MKQIQVKLNEEYNGLKFIQVNDGFVLTQWRLVENGEYCLDYPDYNTIHKWQMVGMHEGKSVWTYVILFATSNLNLEGVPVIEENSNDIYVLLADGDGTMRSKDEPFGVAVKTKEAAEKYVKEGGVGYTHSYRELKLFNSSKEAIDWKYKNINPKEQQTMFTEEQVREALRKQKETNGMNQRNQFSYKYKSEDEIIQSLKQPKVEITFEENQCDGCKANIPLEGSIHKAPYPSGPIVCQKSKYNQPIKAILL